jgi:hypothetical protein
MDISFDSEDSRHAPFGADDVLPDAEEEHARRRGWEPDPDDEVEGGAVLAVEIANTPFVLYLGLSEMAEYVALVQCFMFLARDPARCRPSVLDMLLRFCPEQLSNLFITAIQHSRHRNAPR